MMILGTFFLIVFASSVPRYAPDVVCPVAALSRDQSGPSKYVYRVFYSVARPSHRSARYRWQVSNGKIIGSSMSRQLIVDTSTAQAETVTVTLRIRWKNPGFKCESTLTDTIHLRR